MKKLSSKRARACAISPKVKSIVWRRDNERCVYCGSPLAFPEAHYIPRSKGGLGIEENILTLCRKHHDAFDFGPDREKMKAYFREYLMNIYPDWNEKNLVYKKGL